MFTSGSITSYATNKTVLFVHPLIMSATTFSPTSIETYMSLNKDASRCSPHLLCVPLQSGWAAPQQEDHGSQWPGARTIQGIGSNLQAKDGHQLNIGYSHSQNCTNTWTEELAFGGKQKLLAQWRPLQAGPRTNMATVADVQLLTAAKCKGEDCQTTLRPGFLLYTSLLLQHFLNHGGSPAAHPGFYPSCTKTSWELPYKPDSLWKTRAEDPLAHEPNTVPLSIIIHHLILL